METLRKQPNEIRYFDMNFSLVLDADETITAIVVAAASIYHDPAGGAANITLDSDTFTSKRVQVRLSGGDAGVIYKVTVRVQTSKNPVIEGDGLVEVVEI